MVLPRSDFLIGSTIRAPTLLRYSRAVASFEHFCASRRLPLGTLPNVDLALQQYLLLLYEDGANICGGRNTLYGFKLIRLRATSRDLLPRAVLSLKGWVVRCPGRMRLPLPEAIVFWLASTALQLGHVEVAIAISLQLDTYARPSEIVSLTMGQILPPAPFAGSQWQRWGLVFAPQDMGKPKFDDSLFVADVAHFWLSDVLRHLYDPAALESARVFTLTLAKYEAVVSRVTAKLHLQQLGVCPHSFRHSGASNDRALHRRSLGAVQKRGRWIATTSVARYEKAATLLQQYKKGLRGTTAKGH